MKSLLGAITIMFLTQAAHAGPFVSEGLGPMDLIADCKGVLEDGTKVYLEVRSTAVPTLISSVLVDMDSNEVISNLTCVRTGEASGNVPTEILSCEDYPRNGISVKILAGGFVPKTAEVTLDQMFPLPPQHLGSLICQ